MCPACALLWCGVARVRSISTLTLCWSVLDFWKIIWKNQVRQTGFLVYFELDFYCLCSLQKSSSKLIFAGQKSSLSNLIFTTWFFKNQVQINRWFVEYGISYLINSFSSDKNELAPFSLHSEAADRDRPRPLEAAGRAKNRLFSLVEEAEWVVTGDADLKIPKWSVLLFRGNKPAEDLCLLVLVSPPVVATSDSRGLCWTLKINIKINIFCNNYQTEIGHAL